MELTIAYVLSPADSAQAHAFARSIFEQASRFDRLALARYGMNIFQQCPSGFDLVLESCNIISKFPGVGDYIRPFMTDTHRVSAFASEVALHVHFLQTRWQKSLNSTEVTK